MSGKHRTLAAILAALMILPCVACAANDGDTSKTGDVTTIANAESDTSFFPDVEKRDYNGATFCLSGTDGKGSWYLADEYKSGDENINVLNNTIYEMNTLIEDHLNVELVSGSTAGVPVETAIMSSDDIYQALVQHAYWEVAPYISRNFVMDMNELDALDFSQFYWNGDIIEELSINDHVYVAVGDICQSELHMIYTNKDLMSTANIKMPYDQVRNGEWTFDTMSAMTADLYIDDGDGQRNNKDIYGFAGGWADWGAVLPQASDTFVASKNSDGGFDLSLYNDRTVEFYEKVFNWTQDESVKIWFFGSPDSEHVDFANNQAYLHGSTLGPQYLSVEFKLGILPMPKYEVSQENYSHVNWGDEILVPTTVKNRDMVGQVLELLSFYSGTMVREKYYDEVLQLRVSEAPDDRDMVELIYNTVVYDPGMVYAHAGGSETGSIYPLIYTFYFCVEEGKPNITSYYKAYDKPAQKQINNLVKKVSQRS